MDYFIEKSDCGSCVDTGRNNHSLKILFPLNITCTRVIMVVLYNYKEGR